MNEHTSHLTGPEAAQTWTNTAEVRRNAGFNIDPRSRESYMTYSVYTKWVSNSGEVIYTGAHARNPRTPSISSVESLAKSLAEERAILDTLSPEERDNITASIAKAHDPRFPHMSTQMYFAKVMMADVEDQIGLAN